MELRGSTVGLATWAVAAEQAAARKDAMSINLIVFEVRSLNFALLVTSVTAWIRANQHWDGIRLLMVVPRLPSMDTTLLKAPSKYNRAISSPDQAAACLSNAHMFRLHVNCGYADFSTTT